MKQKVHQVEELAEKQEEEVLRVQAFQRYVDDADWKKFKRRPELIVDPIVLGPGGEFRSDERQQCEEIEGDKETAYVMGYIKMKKGQEQQLEARSGQGGVFIEKLFGKSREGPITPKKWVQKQKEESHKEYLTKALKEASEAGKPVVYRRGGGACLGIKGLESEQKAGTMFVIKNAPNWWGPVALKEWLERKGFQQIKGLSQPRSASQG